MKEEREEKLIKYLRSLIIRSMSVVIIFLIFAIISKNNIACRDIIVKNVYQKSISFPKIKQFYKKYLGGIEPLDKAINNELPVFSEKLEYTNVSLYHDGAKLQVINNYLVPIQKEGMIIYIGEKENYGNVVIVEGSSGIDIWYGNMGTVSSKLYDYVEKGSYLGTTKGNVLYLAYQQDGKFLDYKEFLKWRYHFIIHI